MGTILNYSNMISTNDKAIGSKCTEYLEYIAEHIENVRLAYTNLICNPAIRLEVEGYSYNDITRIIDELAEEIQKHDQSKYSNEEFYAYRHKFYPTEIEAEKIKMNPEYAEFVNEAFEAAWQHHYEHNPHHPKYHRGNEMNLIDILHMICDWEAMSIKFKSKTVDWYNTKAEQEKKDMNPKTREIVESLLEQLYDVKIPKEEI